MIIINVGGETSSVIGTILSARRLYNNHYNVNNSDNNSDNNSNINNNHENEKESRQNLFFVFNNPSDQLIHLDRSRSVLEDPYISKIGLCTGPQAVTGSTRMQATTIETFVLGIILEEAIQESGPNFFKSRSLIFH